MKNKIKNFLNKKNRLLLFSIAAVFFIFLSFQIFNSFMARGEEHSVKAVEFEAFGKDDNLSVACGDTDGDTKDEIVVIKNNKKPEIAYFNEKGNLKDSFVVKMTNSEIDMATGDIDADGQEEVMIVPEAGDSLVKILKEGKLFREFRAFKNAWIGASITSGDINGDGQEEIILGAGEGGGPQVMIYNYKGQELKSFFTFNPLVRSGINVASGDLNKDGSEEIFIAKKSKGQGIIRIYDVQKEISLFDTVNIYPANTEAGINMAMGDIEGDEREELFTAKEVENDKTELKILTADKKVIEPSSATLLNLEGEVEMDICDFGDRRAMVLNSERDNKVRVVYNY